MIQKATSKTGKITSFDHTSILERIRQREDRSIPHPPDEHTPSWSANTEPGYLLLEAPELSISNVQVVPRKSFRTPNPTVVKMPTPAPIPKPVPAETIPKKSPITIVTFDTLTTPASHPAEKPRPISVPQKPITISAPLVPKPAPVVRPIPAPTPVVAPAPAPTPVKTTPSAVPVRFSEPLPTNPDPAIPAQPETEIEIDSEPVTPNPAESELVRPAGSSLLRQSSLREWLFTISTNTISLGISGIVIALTFVGIIGYYWFSTQVQTLELQTFPNHPVIVEAPLQLINSESLQAPILFSLIKSNSAQSTYDVLQLGFIDSPDGKTLLEPQTIFSALNFRLDTAFMKAVSQVYFGEIKQETPFILMRVTDTRTAQGGMLGWEKAMYADLAPLLKENQLSAEVTTFTDITSNQTDLRVLDTKTGTELLVYGFIDRHTLIITTDQEAFASLAALIK